MQALLCAGRLGGKQQSGVNVLRNPLLWGSVVTKKRGGKLGGQKSPGEKKLHRRRVSGSH